MWRESEKEIQRIYAEYKADNLSKRVIKNNQFNTISIGATVENYGYDKKNANAVRALKLICNELGIDTTKGKVSGMQVTDETAKLGWENLKKPSIFALVNTVNGKCIVSSSKSPWLRRAVMYYWLKNINTYGDSNTFFGHSELIKDVEKYGPDVFKLHFIQYLPPHISPLDRIALENEAERMVGDKLYFTKNPSPRDYSPLRPFLHYHPELVELDTRFRKIKAHFLACTDKRDSLKGPKHAEERRVLAPVLEAAHQEYSKILEQQNILRNKLIKQYSKKD